ncbi:hypothetical protein RIR_jg29851.t1 [Rhizophagus irregularis DAOM 181602=DAOM 197198]|nr:hypothetical protein RIR_jg29851.t1 [Rhizophagus irregularis DAOM 181602=DAOM 197198]
MRSHNWSTPTLIAQCFVAQNIVLRISGDRSHILYCVYGKTNSCGVRKIDSRESILSNFLHKLIQSQVGRL